jgi:hypothetical protein
VWGIWNKAFDLYLEIGIGRTKIEAAVDITPSRANVVPLAPIHATIHLYITGLVTVTSAR